MLLSLLAPTFALACGLEGTAAPKPLVKPFHLAEIGSAYLIVEAPGCPQPSPLRVSLVADCGDSNLKIPTDGAPACSVQETDWQPETGVLKVKYFESGASCPAQTFGKVKTVSIDLFKQCNGGKK